MRRLSITDEAQQQITNIADYLDSEWSIRVRDNFLRKIDVTAQTIIQMPFAFPEAENLPDI